MGGHAKRLSGMKGVTQSGQARLMDSGVERKAERWVKETKVNDSCGGRGKEKGSEGGAHRVSNMKKY